MGKTGDVDKKDLHDPDNHNRLAHLEPDILECEVKWASGSITTNKASESEVAQSCPTLHNPMDCSLPGSSVHGIFQARVLEWVAIAFSIMLFN